MGIALSALFQLLLQALHLSLEPLVLGGELVGILEDVGGGRRKLGKRLLADDLVLGPINPRPERGLASGDVRVAVGVVIGDFVNPMMLVAEPAAAERRPLNAPHRAA